MVKSVLKVCSKFTGEHPYQSVISIKLQSNFIKITFWHGCSPVNLLQTPFTKNTFGRLLLYVSLRRTYQELTGDFNEILLRTLTKYSLENIPSLAFSSRVTKRRYKSKTKKKRSLRTVLDKQSRIPLYCRECVTNHSPG